MGRVGAKETMAQTPEIISRTTEVVDFRDPVQVRGALERAETMCRRLSVNSPECFLARDVARDADQSMQCWAQPGHPECMEHMKSLSPKYGTDYSLMCARGAFSARPDTVEKWLCAAAAAAAAAREVPMAEYQGVVEENYAAVPMTQRDDDDSTVVVTLAVVALVMAVVVVVVSTRQK